MKPVILITHKSDMDVAEFGIGKMHQVRSNYCRAIVKAGGIPIITATADAVDYADIADGLLLTGGSNDVDPARYREENRMCLKCDFEIDQMEFGLFEAFYKQKKPIFGICRGHQVINVAMGGSLYQHVKDDHTPLSVHADIYAGGPKIHPMKSVPGSLFEQLFGEEFMTNSHHHQAVKTCGKGMRATAVTEENLIEGIEHESLPIFGVQWHPERMIGEENFDLTNMMPLFEHFINCCKK